ncbi:MAG TPA: PBP1A family penicillin-binding protein [Bacillota bacterium]|nr:PBP1A family penicillin-binding protein [Bacillota bacterium]
MKKNDEQNKRSVKSIVNWVIIPIAIIGILSFIGYSFIIYGGRLVVDEQALILDMTTTIETVDGDVITEIYTENRQPIELADIPQHVIDAFVAIEDERFYQHAGVDFKSVVRAVYRDIIAFSKAEGASTITQQLAKNLFLSHDKTWMRKTKEAMAAIYLERTYTKDEILELYLNAIYFGHGVYGIEAASEKYFSKTAENLTIAEGALLAGIINGPGKYSPIDHPDLALERRNIVLRKMADNGYLSAEQSLTESGKTLGLQVKESQENPWVDSYVDLVLKEVAREYQRSFAELQRGGYRIVVHLDDMIQQIAYEAFLEDDYFPGNSSNIEGAFVMIDQATGQIVAALGGRDYELGDLNRAVIKRQPGSALKPLAVYGPAFMQEMYHPFSMIPDEPLEYDGYVATNYDGSYAGEVTIYEAFITSKNAPAVWLLNEIGINYTKDFLTEMDLAIEDDDLAIALGGLKEGFSPLQMASSYQMIANHGEMRKPTTIAEIYDRNNQLLDQPKQTKHRVFSSQAAWDLTKLMLATVNEGTAQTGTYNKALAGKTGSTEHPHAPNFYKDAWFVGYTPEYVTALWMGYDHSDKDHYLLQGSAAPTKLTKDILTKIDQQFALAETFERPKDVEDLPDPIELPKITNIKAEYIYNWWPFVQGKLSWSGSTDERIIYNVYEQKASGTEKIGQVTGESSFIIEDVSIMNERSYFIVPFDPLTGREGERSETVTLSW